MPNLKNFNVSNCFTNIDFHFFFKFFSKMHYRFLFHWMTDPFCITNPILFLFFFLSPSFSSVSPLFLFSPFFGSQCTHLVPTYLSGLVSLFRRRFISISFFISKVQLYNFYSEICKLVKLRNFKPSSPIKPRTPPNISISKFDPLKVCTLG